MSRDEGAGAGSILVAFILGAVSGAAFALLYAPATGRETREYLGDKAAEARARAADAAAKGRAVVSPGRETIPTAVERADKLFADLSVRIDDTLNLVQASVIAPAREGRALLSAFRAAFHAVRELRQARARQARSDDEDALFI